MQGPKNEHFYHSTNQTFKQYNRKLLFHNEKRFIFIAYNNIHNNRGKNDKEN